MTTADGRNSLICVLVWTGLAAGLLWFSQTYAFAWDEGFHLLAAQLIKAGRQPYIDFAFPQTPLNAYWNAFWMWLCGESWRTTHAIAALETSFAILLTAQFAWTRFPDPWRLPSAIATALAIGFNVQLVLFGTIGQAYGLCLVLVVCGYRLAIASVSRESLITPALAGLCASAAAGSSLLTAPVIPVLLVWLMIFNRAGRRWWKGAAYVAGTILPVLPILRLYLRSPRPVLFGVVQYNAYYRKGAWPWWAQHDVDVLLAWIDSPQATLLGVLAVGGLAYIFFRSDWPIGVRAEFYLCAWLSLAVSALIATAHPTFERYFLFSVPFLSLLAAAGLLALSTSMQMGPRWPVLAWCLLLGLEIAKPVWDNRGDFRWYDFEAIAAEVNRVTPPGAAFVANESVYFVAKRIPPSGMELGDSHRLSFSAPFANEMHLMSQAEINRRVQAREFATVETCEDDWIQEQHLADLYAQRRDVSECAIFSNLKAGATLSR